ncbi:substrate-binding domain-containing protein [Paenibacillus sp.]|jgi:ribose transport system substrate-binding protein|uniref:substrate-binding domain-containing protein n=1 Tax=Paenibacillus sp. TaxID=58172 RepID=UPI00282CB606|nr:substrate-binding domain-containing protein [Paenibacillus sp.]MDR0269676.1 substrate-binding domain-containing protein [Paenibacillus sp.]
MPNRKWLLGLIVLVLIFGYVLIRFFSSTMKVDELVHQIEQSKTEDSSVKHVVLIAQELDNPFWREMEQGANQAADKLGMKIDYMGPIRINPAEQMELLEKSIAAKPDAILIQGINNPDYDLLISHAIDQGIPVLTVDADEPGSRRLAYVGTDNLEAGKQMGQLVVKNTEGNGRIGVMIGSELADNQRLRLEGFRSVIAAAPGFEIIDIRSSNISRIGAAKQAESMLNQHGDIDTMVGFSALDAAGISEGVKASDKEGVRVYGFDDLEVTRKGISAGEILASVVQQPGEIGAKSVNLLDHWFKGEKLSGQYFIQTNILARERMKNGGSSQ